MLGDGQPGHARLQDLRQISGSNRIDAQNSLSTSSASRVAFVRREVSREEARELVTLDENEQLSPEAALAGAGNAGASPFGLGRHLKEGVLSMQAMTGPQEVPMQRMGGDGRGVRGLVRRTLSDKYPRRREPSYELQRRFSSGDTRIRQEGQTLRDVLQQRQAPSAGGSGLLGGQALRSVSVSGTAEVSSASAAEGRPLLGLVDGWATGIPQLGALRERSSQGTEVGTVSLPVASVQQLLLPSDLLGFTRKRMFLVMDSDSARLFEGLRRDTLAFSPLLLLSPERLRRVQPPETQVRPINALRTPACLHVEL
jgi:hypothetical protein